EPRSSSAPTRSRRRVVAHAPSPPGRDGSPLAHMMTNENARHRQPGRFRRMMSRIGLARRSPETAPRPPGPQEQEPAPVPAPAPHTPEGYGQDPYRPGEHAAPPGADPHAGAPPEGARHAPPAPPAPSPYARPQSPPHRSAQPEPPGAAPAAQHAGGASDGARARRQDRVPMTDVVAGMATRC